MNKIMPRRKTSKTKLTLSVDKNLVDAAKTIGINLSAFLEIKLREYLSVLKNGYTTNIAWTGGDLNPRPSPCQGDALPG